MPAEKSSTTTMTQDAASRIQSATDKATNEIGNKGDGFAARAQSAAAKNDGTAAATSGGNQQVEHQKK